jgi:hypothetical protein
MAAIGELFKTLGKNEIFNELCKKIEYGSSNNDIIEDAINNEELMNILKQIIEDVNVIKNKMDVLIGQKRKTFEKLQEKKNMEETSGEKEVQNKDAFSLFNKKPLNRNNVVWLNDKSYLERIDLKIRMVFFIEDNEYEMIY